MSKTLRRWVLAAGTALSVVACNAEAPRFALKHTEQRGKLPNGLRFVLMPDPSTQLVEVDVRYDVGSREDPPGKAGLAHVIEHLMFQPRPDGAATPPLFQFIEDLSVGFNAYTNEDSTHYQTEVRSELADASIKIESMRLFFGCQTISQEEFEREREVVRNEIRQRGGTAEGQIDQLVMSSIYPKGHAYEHTVGGDDRELSSITLQDACDFIKKYYVPERATVLIAGGIDVDQTVASIQKWFGPIKPRPAAPRVVVKPFTIEHGTKTYELDVERPSVHVAWALPALNTPEGEAIQFGITNAFIRTASKAQEYDFATRVTPQILGGKLAPVFMISIELKSMKNLDEALDFVNKAAKQAHRGFDEGTSEEIEEEKNRTKAEYIQGLERLGDRTNTLGDLVQFSKDVDFDSRDIYIFKQLDKIADFDGSRIGDVVKKYIDPEKARIVIIKPNKEGIKGDVRSSVTFQTKSDDHIETGDADPIEAKHPIKVAAELKSLSGATRFTLANGMKAVLLPIHAMPLISAQLVFANAGTASTPDSPALALGAARFLSLPADAEAFAKTGVSVNCAADSDAAICETGGVSIYLDVMIKGLERLITAGDYHQEQIEGWQKQQRGRFESRLVQQQLEFRRQVLTAVLGPDHPYTKTGVLNLDAINKLHRDALDGFRHGRFTAANATLVVVGDFDPAGAEQLIRSTFGGWSAGALAKPVEPGLYKRSGAAFVGVVGKEEPQLSVAIAYPAPPGIDGQDGARRVLAEMMNIRVGDVRFKLGSTYGVYAGTTARRGANAYQMGGNVDAERAGESVKAMRDGIDMLRNGTHFDEDFVRARRKILGELLGESTVTAELSARLAFIAEFNLSSTFYNTLLQQVAAVSPAQVRALIQTELDPNNEVVVVLGDKPHLDKMFSDAGIKDVKIVDPTYK